MIRRRRRPREIPFSLDSFLDLVANVVGIIIRLILIAWVGARTYTGLKPPEAPPASADLPSAEPLPHDPLEDELARHRQELEQAQQRLLEQLRQLPPVREDEDTAGQELAALGARRQALAGEKESLGQALAAQKQAAGAAMPTLTELRERGKRLAKAVADLEKLPPAKKVLHYRTPVSRPVHNEEVQFECKAGRVTLVDMPAFVAQIKADVEGRLDQLRQQRRIEGVTEPAGVFRMRYAVEVGVLDSRIGAAGHVEPLQEVRGEALEAALAPGSEFRHVIESLDAKQTVVTFWVYPDSFALFRQLRDFLYGRDIEVAGRPLREGSLIGFAPDGTRSRGQ
jgi:hypothetical protein